MMAARGILGAAAVYGCLMASCRTEHRASAMAAAEQSVGVGCLGKITPGDRVIRLSAPPGSIIKALRVQRGSQVKRGQELAILRDYDAALAALREAQCQVAVAASAVAQARAGEKPATITAQEMAVAEQELVLQNAEKELRRKTELFREGLLAEADFDAAALSAESARGELRRQQQLVESLKQVRYVDVTLAERKLELAKVQEDRANAELERNRVTAPISATVLELYAYPGEAVSDQGILDLGDTENMFVDAEVYVSDVRRVREGAKAVISGDALPRETSGRVIEILRETSDSKLYPDNPLNAADKRVIKVRIGLEDPASLRRLSNSQVFVKIEP